LSIDQESQQTNAFGLVWQEELGFIGHSRNNKLIKAGSIGVRHANRCVACPYKTTRCVSKMLKRIDTG
jgi:hypothetical protein